MFNDLISYSSCENVEQDFVHCWGYSHFQSKHRAMLPVFSSWRRQITVAFVSDLEQFQIAGSSSECFLHSRLERIPLQWPVIWSNISPVSCFSFFEMKNWQRRQSTKHSELVQSSAVGNGQSSNCRRDSMPIAMVHIRWTRLVKQQHLKLQSL